MWPGGGNTEWKLDLSAAFALRAVHFDIVGRVSNWRLAGSIWPTLFSCTAWKEDQSCLKRYVLSKLSGRLAMSLVTADMEAINSQLGVEHPYAANDVLKVVRRMFNWSKIAGLVPRDHPNIVAGIVRFPERTRKRFVTTVEMPRLLQALDQEDNDYARHGIWLLLLMGLRSQELLKAKWEDTDWDMGTLFIGPTKNGEPLLAPISDAAVDRLRVIPRTSDNPYIICGRLRGQYLRSLGEPFKRAPTGSRNGTSSGKSITANVIIARVATSVLPCSARSRANG